MKQWVALLVVVAVGEGCSSGSKVAADPGPPLASQPVTKSVEEIVSNAIAAAQEAAASEPARNRDPRWQHNNYQDEMWKGTVYLLTADAVEPLELGFPYEGRQWPTVTVRRSGKIVDVLLRIERGQFVCGAFDCSTTIRFDDGAPEKFTMLRSADHDSSVLFVKAAQRFETRAKKARKIRIQATIYKHGSPVLTFEPGPLEWPPMRS